MVCCEISVSIYFLCSWSDDLYYYFPFLLFVVWEFQKLSHFVGFLCSRSFRESSEVGLLVCSIWFVGHVAHLWAISAPLAGLSFAAKLLLVALAQRPHPVLPLPDGGTLQAHRAVLARVGRKISINLTGCDKSWNNSAIRFSERRTEKKEALTGSSCI